MKKTLIWIISIIIVIGVVVGTILLLNNSNNSINNYDYEEIIGKSFIMADNSYIVFKDNKRFIWYKTKEDKDNNYYEGTYTVYRGENAIRYISNELTIYAVTEQEQRDLIDRNSKWQLDNYFNINLHNERAFINNEETKMNSDTNYFGFANNDYTYFDIANMKTSNYTSMTLDK